MKHVLLPCLLLLLTACGEDEHVTHTPPPANGWSSAGAWSVLDAQEHRNTERLCALLSDTLPMVRAQAAMALASVQDSVAVPCLLKALGDPDATVRMNAAFAFGFCGDSLDMHRLLERLAPEENADVRMRIEEAIGRCGRMAGAEALLRRGMPTQQDSLGVMMGLYRAVLAGVSLPAIDSAALQMTNAAEGIALYAAHALMRTNEHVLTPFAQPLLIAAGTEQREEVRIALMSALGKARSDSAFQMLSDLAEHDPAPRVRVASLRALAKYDRVRCEPSFWHALTDEDGGVRQTAVEQFTTWGKGFDGDALWKAAQEHSDYSVKIPLYALVMKNAAADTRLTCGLLMKSMAEQDLGPYLNAELIKARMMDPEGNPGADIAEPVLSASVSAQEKLAAFESAFSVYGHKTTSQIELLQRVFIPPCDAGLVSSACERLVKEEPSYIALVLKDEAISSARSILHPIRDLEAIQLLDAAIAKRNGQPAPKHSSPAFNHPIDEANLGLLKEGQRYRILADSGEVIIALEVDVAPGSCFAFDSLVNAGYYNGKYFHRVIPNFVAQGGCPRGDGFGGMDWTLRTEVGYNGFSTGAVGLASAGHDTESCQFFIMTAPAPHLDGRYTRFAHVVSGMEVVQRLRVGSLIQKVERL